MKTSILFAQTPLSATILLLFFCGMSSAEFEIDLGGTIGTYFFPKQVNGHVENLYNSPFEASKFVDGLTNTGYSSGHYEYHHPFPKEFADNKGFQFSAQYFFPEQFGLGLEYANGQSREEFSLDQSTEDSVANSNSVIPADYQVNTMTSRDIISLKHSLIGLVISMRKKISKRIRVGAAIGMGEADYTFVCKLGQKTSISRYYQSNGHEVYSETVSSQGFNVIGIDYSSLYFRPEVTARYALGSHIGLSLGFSLPISTIEKGKEWIDNAGYFANATTTTFFYPEKGFFAGNLSLSLGISIAFGQETPTEEHL